MWGRNLIGTERGVKRRAGLGGVHPGRRTPAVTNLEAKMAPALTAGAWNRSTWFSEGTAYLEGIPRTDG